MSSTRTFRCWVPHCINSRKRTRLPKSHYHAFPVRNAERCRRWLQAVGYEDLIYLPMHSLKLRYVCSEHFTDSDYGRTASNNSLLFTAVPSKFPPGTISLSDEIMEEWPPKMASDKRSNIKTEVLASFTPSIPSKPSRKTDKLLASAISAGILQSSSPNTVIVPSIHHQSVASPKLKSKVNVESVATPSSIVDKRNNVSLSRTKRQPSIIGKTILPSHYQNVSSPAYLDQPTGSIEIKFENNSDSETELRPFESDVKSKLPSLPQDLLVDHLNQNAEEGLLDGDMLLGFVVQRNSSLVLVPVGPGHSMMVAACLDELNSSNINTSTLTSPPLSSNGLSNVS